ncbi:MAG: site-specific integrase [Thermodesulfobacteriota bacterium]
MNFPSLPATIPTNSTLDSMSHQARTFASKSRARRTVEGYRSDWLRFQRWCMNRSLQESPASPSTVADYLISATSGPDARKVGTIGRWLAAISSAHRFAGLPDPTQDPAVQLVWQGIRRELGTRQHGKTALLTHDIKRMVEPLTDSPLDARDRALLLVGFASMLRRSELVALDVDDLTSTDDGLKILVRKSKTDQQGAGQEIGIPFGEHPSTCPVLALRRWLDLATITHGAVFRQVRRGGHITARRLSSQVVGLIVKNRASGAGIDATNLAGHSLRRGLATSAARAGVSNRSIQRQGRWKSPTMVDRYVEDAALFVDNAAARVGL